MPINKDALSRYRWIDERLRNKQLPPPGLQDLIRYVSKKMDQPVSVRTIQKDIEDMRFSEKLNYHAPIKYDRSNKIYYYGEEGYSISNMPVSEFDLQGLEIAISILEQFKKLPVIKQFEDAILKIAAALKINREKLEHGEKLLQLEMPVQYKGLEWLSDIAEAMKEHKIIRFAYQSFERNEPKEHWVEPYHLREYSGAVFPKCIRHINAGAAAGKNNFIFYTATGKVHFIAAHSSFAGNYKKYCQRITGI
jgi:hypothetical protein